MKINSLRLVNYRRFVGDYKIDFATDKKNITLIRAQNGAGKTGILMALLFGLFGIIKYDQFRIEADDDVMVSRKVLEQNSQAETIVEIEFEENARHYKIVRKVKARIFCGKPIQDNENIVSYLYEDDNIIFDNTEKINKFMDNIIGENIRGFLFFDGVRYMELFQKDDKKTKKELQQIIEKILNIGDIDNTIYSLKSIFDSLSSTSSNKKLITEIKNIRNDLLENESKRDKVKKEKEDLKKKIEELTDQYNKKLSEKYEIKKNEIIINQYNKIKNDIELNKNEIEKMNAEIVNTLQIKIISFINFSLDTEIRKDFETIANTDDSSVINNFIKSILMSSHCICGNKLNEENKKNLELLINNSRTTISLDSIYRAKLVMRELDNSLNTENDITKLYEKYKNLITKNDELNYCLQNEIRKLSDVNKIESISENLSSIEYDFGRIEGLKKEYEENISKIDDEIKKYKDIIDDLTIQKEKKMKTMLLEDKQINIYNFYKSTWKKLYSLKETYLKETQENISKKANEYFFQLLSNDDKAAFDRLIIDQNYSIKAYNKKEQNIFSQLSAGQKLLASMAFTMGLTAVASNAKPMCNFPLVMDTPMSNLDTGNRERLINVMPTVVEQWILTPMDTELTDVEIEYFINTNKVGKVYQLQKRNDLSIITELSTVEDLKGGIINE